MLNRGRQPLRPTVINGFKSNPFVKLPNLNTTLSIPQNVPIQRQNVINPVLYHPSININPTPMVNRGNINPGNVSRGNINPINPVNSGININPYINRGITQRMSGDNNTISGVNPPGPIVISPSFTEFIENFDTEIQSEPLPTVPTVETTIDLERQKMIEELREKNMSKCLEIINSINDGTFSEESECMICMDKINEPVVVLCCCKVFCQECIQAWIENRGSCVHCRFEEPVLLFPEDIENIDGKNMDERNDMGIPVGITRPIPETDYEVIDE